MPGLPANYAFSVNRLTLPEKLGPFGLIAERPDPRRQAGDWLFRQYAKGGQAR
jgi:hypothetical protein